MIFLDLVKIYNVFYIMTMETLDRYKRMSTTEMSKALVLYQNFCSFTETLKKEANTIPMLFGFTFKEPNYYKPDPNKERAMRKALKDKESGGDGFMEDDGLGDDIENLPEFEDQEVKRDYSEDEKEEEDSDDDYQFDLLGDIKKQEEMASVHGAKKRNTVAQPQRREKIQVDDFNTAALDDLLGGAQPKPERSGTMVPQSSTNPDDDENEWDPFANKGQNVYSTQQPAQAVPETKQNASNNIFGDEDNDMWGDNPTPAVSNNQASKQEQRQTLDDLLGGGDEDVGAGPGGRSQSMAVPSSDYNMLKNLYNTASVPANTGGMGGGQQDYYTGMQNNYGGGMDNMGQFNTGGGGYNQGYNNQGYNQGYNQNMGYGQNMGYNQPQSYNTGYPAGNNYGGYNQGYNNQNMGYGQNTGMGGGQPQSFNTAAPGGNAQNNDFDPFS